MIDCQCITTVAATNLTVIRIALNYHGVIRGALKNQKVEAEAKSGTLDRELIFLKYGLVCFSKTSGKVGACSFKKQAEQSVQRKGDTI